MKNRPLGVTLISILYFVSGIAIFILRIPLYMNLDKLKDPLRRIGMPPVLLLAGTMILAVVATGAGIGMWLGKRWGWYLGAFYVVYGIARNLSATAIILSLWAIGDFSDAGTQAAVIRYGSRIAFNFLFLYYFLRANVIEYFDLEAMSKTKALSAMISVCGFIAFIASVVSWVIP